MLLTNEDVFVSKAFEWGLQPIWIVRVLKEISNKSRERFDTYMDRDETYLVWKIVNVGKNGELNGKIKYGYVPTYDREDKNSGGSSRTNRSINDVFSILSCYIETVVGRGYQFVG